MSEFIPSVELKDFNKLNPAEIKELKSVEVTDGGKYLFTAIIPHGDMSSFDYGKTQAEYLAQKTNIVGGKDPEEKAPLYVSDKPKTARKKRAKK
jgi:hypothetical protein